MSSSDVDRGGASQSPLRVAFYLDADSPGGSSTSLAVLVGALDPSYDVTVVGTSETMVRMVADARPGARIKVLTPVASKLDIRSIVEHVRAIRALRPDILHVNLDNPWTSQYGLLAGVVTRTPMVSVLHLPTPPWRRRQGWLVRPLARRIQAYVCVSHHSAQFAESVLHMRPGTARVIHNGMPVPEVFAPAGPASPPGTLRIGAVGRLAEQKALHFLVEAMQWLPGSRLVLVGEGPERAALKTLAGALGLDDRVEFAGWADPPWTSTWSFDVLAMSSVNEGFPLVIVEAMMAGIPVVAPTVGGIPEVVVPGSTGMLVPPGDARALAEALGHLAEHPELRRDMAARGREVAMERFTDGAMAAQFEAVYEEVRAPTSSPGSSPST